MEFSWVIGGTPESFGHWLSVETTSLKWGSHMTFQNPPIYLAFSPTFWMFILTLFRTPLYRLFHPTFWMFYFDISLATNQKKTPKFPICLLAKLYTSGWWFQPLWKNISQLGRIIPYIMEKNVPNHQPASIHPFGCFSKIDEPQTTGFHPQTVSVLKNPSGTLRPSNQIKDSHGFSILKIQDYQRKPRFLFLWERWQILELPHQNVS